MASCARVGALRPSALVLVGLEVGPQELHTFRRSQGRLLEQLGIIRLLLVGLAIPCHRIVAALLALDGGDLADQVFDDFPAGGDARGTGEARPK